MRVSRSYFEVTPKQQQSPPRRILADFLIGAHAMQRDYTLLTLDQRVYSKSFPKLRLEKLSP